MAAVVRQKVFHDGRRDDVADVFGVTARERLKGDADAFPKLVQDGTSGVPGVDRGVNLPIF